VVVEKLVACMDPLPIADLLPDPDAWPASENEIVPLPVAEQMKVYTLVHYVIDQVRRCHAATQDPSATPAPEGAAVRLPRR
jgi:hypothetical protein